jgi:hypothetical protein
LLQQETDRQTSKQLLDPKQKRKPPTQTFRQDFAAATKSKITAAGTIFLKQVRHTLLVLFADAALPKKNKQTQSIDDDDAATNQKQNKTATAPRVLKSLMGVQLATRVMLFDLSSGESSS